MNSIIFLLLICLATSNATPLKVSVEEYLIDKLNEIKEAFKQLIQNNFCYNIITITTDIMCTLPSKNHKILSHLFSNLI